VLVKGPLSDGIGSRNKGVFARPTYTDGFIIGTAIDCTIYFAIITPPSLGSAHSPSGLDCILYIFLVSMAHLTETAQAIARQNIIKFNRRAWDAQLQGLEVEVGNEISNDRKSMANT